MFPHDEIFTKFIDELSVILEDIGPNTMAVQSRQVNGLMDLENQFRRELVRHVDGIKMYQIFVDEKRNILAARPFFRERDTTFKEKISPAMKARDAVALTRFHVNRRFLDWVVEHNDWSATDQGKIILDISDTHKVLRDEIVQANMPLVLSQVRSFHRKNQNSHLDHIDFVQIGAMGLMEAIDKFSGPYAQVFRAVIIGRLVGNVIEANSETYAHFYPRERQILYRLRGIVRKMKDEPIDYDSLHRRLNSKEMESDAKTYTSYGEMMSILGVANVMLAMKHTDEEDGEHGGMPQEGTLESVADESHNRPDVLCEESQVRWKMKEAIKYLSWFEQKVLALMGVESALCYTPA